jgi:fructose-1,6-bisphosphatase I
MATNGASNGNGEANTGTGTEKINLDIITLTRFLTEEQTKHKEATGDFTFVCSCGSLTLSPALTMM